MENIIPHNTIFHNTSPCLPEPKGLLELSELNEEEACAVPLNHDFIPFRSFARFFASLSCFLLSISFDISISLPSPSSYKYSFNAVLKQR